MWLSGVVTDPNEQQICLENALVINPYNAQARRGLEFVVAKTGTPSRVPAPPEPDPVYTFPTELEPDPQDRRATDAELIEPPIVMKRAPTETGVKADPPAKATVSHDNNGQSQKN